MLLNFWLMTAALILGAFCFALPKLKSNIERLSILFFIPLFCYLLYGQYGNSHHLKSYYSAQNEILKTKFTKLRPIVFELKKEELKLRLLLEENPDDVIVRCRLLDIMAIRALQNNDVKLANHYWDEALKQLPDREDTKSLKVRILSLKKNLVELKSQRQ